MKTVAVILDDALHAREVLARALQGGECTHWILVAAAPVRTRHMSQWISASARRQSLERWSEALFGGLQTLFDLYPGHRVERLVVKRPWQEVEPRLRSQHPALQVLDARRPRDLRSPASPAVAPRAGRSGLDAWLSTVGLGALLVVAD